MEAVEAAIQLKCADIRLSSFGTGNSGRLSVEATAANAKAAAAIATAAALSPLRPAQKVQTARETAAALSILSDRRRKALKYYPDVPYAQAFARARAESVDLGDLFGAQAELERAEDAAGLLGGAHADDRGGDGRMAQRPGDGDFAGAAAVALRRCAS